MAKPLPSRGGASLWQILKQTAVEWNEDKAPRLGAALAYYTLFSITPLLLLVIAIASFFVGAEAARGELEEHLQGYLGENGAKAIQALLESASDNKEAGTAAIVISIVSLIFGASGLFNHLKEALNTIWGVEEKHQGIAGFFINRLISILMILVIGLLLLAAVLASTAVAALVKFFGPLLPMGPKQLHFIDLGLSFVVLTVLFAIIFKALPDVKLGMKHVLLGAVFTAVLFALGKFGISQYIARGGMANSYGAAGSLVVLLIWVYYSAQIFFFGAEFTQVYSKMRHIPVEVADSGEVAHEEPHTAEKAVTSA